VAGSWRWLVLAGCGAALAFWAGRHQGAAAPVTATPTAVAPRPLVIERTTIASGSSSSVSREDLRAVIREELEAQRAGAQVAAEDKAEDPARVAAAARAMEAASQVVEAGISDGVWSAQDRAALREQLPRLGEHETQAVLSPLFQAINAQRLQLDGPPI
jgi:hypothetical protein